MSALDLQVMQIGLIVALVLLLVNGIIMLRFFRAYNRWRAEVERRLKFLFGVGS